jgi:Holliday junction resolvase RusA-like endonuclease
VTSPRPPKSHRPASAQLPALRRNHAASGNVAGVAAIDATARKLAPAAKALADAESMKGVTLTLPYPPSANLYWRKTRNGGLYVSPEAKSYKKVVWLIGMKAGARPLTGDVTLGLRVYRPQKSGDLSNRIKVLEDALIGVAFEDDKQVAELHAARFDDAANPRVEVWVEPVRPAGGQT